MLKPGYYRGPVRFVAAHRGSPERPTVLKSQQKYGAIVNGSPSSGIHVMKNCPWVVIDGLTISGSLYSGVVFDSDYCVVRNCHIHNNATNGVGAFGRNNIVIENNLVEFNGQHPQFYHGIYFHGDRVIIRNNIVRYNSGWGLHLYPEVSNSRIENNLVHNNNGCGILVCSKQGVGSNLVLHNTVTENGRGVEIKDGYKDMVLNNIIAYNPFRKEGTSVSGYGGDSLKNVLIDYNLLVPAVKGAGKHNISADPLFESEEKKLFYLQPKSPALKKGISVSSYYRDFLGRAREPGRRCDLGCFPHSVAALSPQARQGWYLGWPFFYKQKLDVMPDLWKLPQEKRPEGKGRTNNTLRKGPSIQD